MLRFSFWCLRPSPRTSFHHQPEAQHLKSSAIHKLGRPITPSFGGRPDQGLRGLRPPLLIHRASRVTSKGSVSSYSTSDCAPSFCGGARHPKHSSIETESYKRVATILNGL